MGLTIKEGRKLDDYEANLIDYRFIAPNKTLIEQEFNDLFVSMEKKLNKQQENDELWAWAYFCCRALEIFYNAQDQKAKAQQFAAYCQQIKNRIDKKI